ncbi:MAG TPA: hypothetical protein VGA00_06800 [Acidiferrobacterales bacterium]
MCRLALLLLGIFVAASSSPAADKARHGPLKDLYFGEALYYAHQGEHFAAIARLDTELGQYYGLDEPGLDTLHYHINDAEFSVGDFELSYRMHLRAGRAFKAVLEGNVPPPVRNEAAYRLARIHFQKDQPREALTALERIQGKVPERIRDDLAFLRANTYMAVGRFADAAKVYREMQNAKGYAGFATYNLGMALIRGGQEPDGLQTLVKAGRLGAGDAGAAAIQDKANLFLGSRLLEGKQPEQARQFLERVHMTGPYSDRALLAWGWAEAEQDRYDRALVPWTLLAKRNVTDKAVQEAMLAVPYAYGRLNVHGKAALAYGSALEAFDVELGKLGASVHSIQEGKFLEALVREELKQDRNWVVKLRALPDSPETYYLLDLLASHDFQESLKNYLDLDELGKHFVTWLRDIDAYEEIIATRRAYYQPLLPELDKQFRVLDSQMRLRLEQRDRLEKRIQAMLVSPRPDFLATAEERIVGQRLAGLEQAVKRNGGAQAAGLQARIDRLQGVLHWQIRTGYDQRLTDAYKNLQSLNEVIAALKAQYTSYVRTRQAASQSYEGYEAGLNRLRVRVLDAQERVKTLMARQGHLLEVMALNELELRTQRLEEYQVKARFALADSYDRAVKAQTEGSAGP